MRYLKASIEAEQAYAAIIYNMAFDDPDFAGGYPVLVLFGDVVTSLFPDLQLCQPAPCAMRGVQVDSQAVLSVDIGGVHILVENQLPPGATFFDVDAAGLPLDRRVVVRAPTETMLSLDRIEREEMVSRAVFLNPSDSVLDTFVSNAAQGGLFLIPHNVSVEQPRRFREIMMRSVMYIVGMTAFLALAFTAFFASARLTIKRERRAFKIRQMYGATPFHIGLRIGGFLAAGILIPQVLLLLLLQIFLLLAGAPAPGAVIWVMVSIVVVFISLWGGMIYEVLTKEGLGGW